MDAPLPSCANRTESKRSRATSTQHSREEHPKPAAVRKGKRSMVHHHHHQQSQQQQKQKKLITFTSTCKNPSHHHDDCQPHPCDGVSVCVTGATGYLGAHLIAKLLEAGYHVRGTVCSSVSELDQTRLLLTKLPGASERLVLIQADLMVPGSFDEAVKGCKYVFHTAIAPCHSSSSSSSSSSSRSSRSLSSVSSGGASSLSSKTVKEELLAPAVDGTLNLLSSVKKHHSVRKVVMTSSVWAVHDSPVDRGRGHVFQERDWNVRSSLRHHPHHYVRTMAEQAAWREYRDRWTLVTILPGLLLGPSLNGTFDAASLSLVEDMVNGKMAAEGVPDIRVPVSDVRDVAMAHVRAAERDLARGRYLAVADCLTYMQLADMLRHRSHRYLLPTVVVSTWSLYLSSLPSLTSWRAIRAQCGQHLAFNCDRIERDLLMRFRSVRGSLLEMVNSWHEWTVVVGDEAPPSRAGQTLQLNKEEEEEEKDGERAQSPVNASSSSESISQGRDGRKKQTGNQTAPPLAACSEGEEGEEVEGRTTASTTRGARSSKNNEDGDGASVSGVSAWGCGVFAAAAAAAASSSSSSKKEKKTKLRESGSGGSSRSTSREQRQKEVDDAVLRSYRIAI